MFSACFLLTYTAFSHGACPEFLFFSFSMASITWCFLYDPTNIESNMILISYTVLQYEHIPYQQCPPNYSSLPSWCCEMDNSLQKSSKGNGKPEHLNYFFEKYDFVLQFIEYNPHLWKVSKRPDLIIFFNTQDLISRFFLKSSSVSERTFCSFSFYLQ